jgi:branched-chain amino acid aminotransferase
MSRIASINGAIFPLESAVVPVLDRGFLYGDGVFETIRVYGGRPFLQDEHLARLERSAAALRIKLPVSLAELAREIGVATDAAQEPEAYVRITITRGAAAEASLVPPSGLRATRVIVVQPVRPPAREVYARGLRAITLAWDRGGERGPAGSAKLLSYATNILALDEARARGADEVIFVGPDDVVRDASASNVFVIDGAGRVVTPSEGPGVLGGITRGQVFDLACSLGLTCGIETVSRRTLAQAHEVFLTSSVREIVSVIRLDDAVIGSGTPGEIARTIHRALRFRAGATGPAPWE